MGSGSGFGEGYALGAQGIPLTSISNRQIDAYSQVGLRLGLRVDAEIVTEDL